MLIKLSLCMTIAVILMTLHFHLKVIRRSSNNSPRPRKKEEYSNSIKVNLAHVEVRGMKRSIKVKSSPASRMHQLIKTSRVKQSVNQIALSYFTVNYEDEQGRAMTFESPVMSIKQCKLRTQLNHQKETTVHFDRKNPRKFAMELQFLDRVS